MAGKRSLAADGGQFMMRGMLHRRPRPVFAAIALATAGSLLSGCAGVSPPAEAIAARELAATPADVDRTLVDAHVADARTRLAQRRNADAASAARAALALDPRCARAHAVLGLALVQQAAGSDPPQRQPLAEGDGETLLAVRLAPDDPLVARLRGEALAACGHLTAAAAAAEAGLQQVQPRDEPDYVALVEAAAVWCYELGEEQRALPHLRELAQRRPDAAVVHFRIGACLLRTATDADAALAAARAFQRCAELAPGDDDAWLAVVAAMSRAATFQRQAGADATATLTAAADAARAAAARFPQSAEAEFRVGVLAEQLQDQAAARAAYDRALVRDDRHLGALLNAARLLAADGGAAAAAALWRRALAIDAESGGLAPRERLALRELLGRDEAAAAADQTPRML